MDQRATLPDRRFSGVVNGLVTKIRTGDCVLVLGPRIAIPPEVMGQGGVAIDDYLSANLLSDLGDSSKQAIGLRALIARYEREKNPAECRSFIEQLLAALDQQTTELHRELASLPFRLVLAATADRMMFNAFRAVGKQNAREACYDYCRGVSSETPLTLPTTDKPIVYSLFGRHDVPESMVLNDRNLLDYLVRITRETPALPDPIRATLRAPSTVFLFLGFGFANWWLRLLLKVLDITGVENRGLSLALEDDSFDAKLASENTGFFESLGIYVQTRDWNAMAKELAAKFQQQPPLPAAPAQTSAPSADPLQRGPLAFLSYASEDAEKVDALRIALQGRGVSVWQDRQNLRAGQNWQFQIARLIKEVDYFVFIQTENMDRRDRQGSDGVYNRELKHAIERHEDRPYGAVFIFHVTIGSCQPRPEPQLAELHRIAVDTDAGVTNLADAILKSYADRHELQAR